MEKIESMSDIELIKLAAKAAGYNLYVVENTGYFIGQKEGLWNPLYNDADAFRLAVCLGLTVEVDKDDCVITVYSNNHCGIYKCETHGNETEIYEIVRRAIVVVAAKIGQLD